MDNEQAAKYKYWKSAIWKLDIGCSICVGDVYVSRESNNRFVVTTGDNTQDIGGRNTRPKTAIALTLSAVRKYAIDGCADQLLCARCAMNPRLWGKSYCRACAAEIALSSKHKRIEYYRELDRKRRASKKAKSNEPAT